MPASEREIWLSAAKLIAEHGAEAWENAILRYFERKKEGDQDGMMVWRRVSRAIDDFTNTNPGGSEH